MIIVWVLLAILGLLLLLLCIPVVAQIDFLDVFSIRVRYGLVHLKLLPAKEKTPKQKKAAEEKKAKKEARKKRRELKKGKKAKELPQKGTAKKNFFETVGIAVDLAAEGKGFLGCMLRHAYFYQMRLEVTVATEDAATTAITYGKMNGWVYSLYALAKNFLKIGTCQIRVGMDFLHSDTTICFHTKMRVIPLVALGAALKAGFGFLKRQMAREAEENHSKTEKPKVVQ